MMRFLIAILLFFLLHTSAGAEQPSKDVDDKVEFVMILNSYPYEHEWGTSLGKEIRNYLETKRKEIKINITYAGIEARTSFLADRFAMQGAFAYGRLDNKTIQPDVLVLIGDESWMLYRVMDHRGKWGKIPVVLCGVHAEVMKDYRQFFPDKQLADTSFVPLQSTVGTLPTVAVIEPDNAARTLQLARTLVPDLQCLYYLSNGSYTDTYLQKKLQDACNREGIPVQALQVERGFADTAEQALEKLSDKSVIVTNGVVVPEQVRVPVLTLRDVTYRSYHPAGGYFAPISAFAATAGDIVNRILEKGSVEGIPYCLAPDTTCYLNQTALLNAGLLSEAEGLPAVVERNVPPPFIIRHIRIIAVLSLAFVLLLFLVLRVIYSRRYRHNLNAMYERYKTLYNEYSVAYENMPVGLMLCDIYGNLLKRNAETDVFFEKFAHSRSDVFHLFSSDILDEDMRESLLRKEVVSKMIHLQENCYRMQCCLIADEETAANQILVIVIDNTEIEQEKRAKEEISNVLNFAMNEAVIGVAEYNLADGKGFATDAWSDILDMDRGITDFSDAHRHLVAEDRQKVERYLKRVRYGLSRRFLESLRMENRKGELHYVRYLIQPVECTPDKKNVIVAELIINMDEQMAREKELETAMRKAREADRFKNAFVANMKNEIRIPMKEIISCARELVETDDMKRRSELNACIEACNNRLLVLLEDIINLSKVELNE